jgi:5-methylcytosine-specific restriction endonuclease McrA
MDQRFCCRGCKDASQKGCEPGHLAMNRGIKPRTYHLRTDVRRNTRTFDNDWRKAVMSRDGFTCRRCGAKGCRLEAHHIKPYADFPSLRYVLSNGLTLCVPCHKRTRTYGWQKMHKERKRLAAKRLSQEVFDFDYSAD